MKEIEEQLFLELTPLGFQISVTQSYWEYITTIKHPYMKSMKSDVIITLKNPDFIRQSKVDDNVYLFYRAIDYNDKNYHMCVIINKIKRFIITAYITDRIKEGTQIWKKLE